MKPVSILIATVLVAAAAFSVGPAEAEVQCNQVVQSLYRCIDCTMSVPCCPRVIRNFKAMMQTAEDKRATCECVKQATGKYAQAIKPEVAAQFLKLCAVDISVPISNKLSAQGRSVEDGIGVSRRSD